MGSQELRKITGFTIAALLTLVDKKEEWSLEEVDALAEITGKTIENALWADLFDERRASLRAMYREEQKPGWAQGLEEVPEL